MDNNKQVFRAWSPTKKHMYHAYDYIAFRFYEDGAWDLGESNRTYVTSKDAILLRGTGIEDKNGKEIYEADRMEWEDGSYGHVVWNKELARFLIANGAIKTPEIEWEKGEIIGNVYET